MNFPRFPSKTYRRRIEGWGKHGEGESKARVSIVSIAASRMRTLEQEEGRPASGPGVSGARVSGGMGTRQEGMSSWRNACLSLELFFILVAGTDMLPDSAMETGKTVFTDGYHRSSMRMQGVFTYNSGQPLLVTQGGLHRGCGLVFTDNSGQSPLMMQKRLRSIIFARFLEDGSSLMLEADSRHSILTLEGISTKGLFRTHLPQD